MSEFQGFPDRMLFTPLPNLVFSSLAGQITDIVELKVLLHVFEILYPKKGNLRYTSAAELSRHPSVVQDLHELPPEVLEQYLETLVRKAVLLRVTAGGEQSGQNLYWLNNSVNRGLLEKIQQGELELKGFEVAGVDPPVPAAAAASATGVQDIFTLYEENIGLITPLIAEELKEAQNTYPESWIREAVKEAVSQNKRNWKYINRILERWTTEGKKDGAYRGNPKKNSDPDKYIRGKYGHMVQR